MFKKIYLILFTTSIIWSSVLPKFKIGPISIFPLRILILLGMAVSIISLIKNDGTYFSKLETFAIVFFVVVILKSFISFFWIPDISTALAYTLFYIESFVIILLCSKMIQNKNDLHYVLITYLLNIFVVSLMGIFESYTGDYIFWNTNYDYLLYTKNFFGLSFPLVYFYNINDLATFLTISLPLLLMIQVKTNKLLSVFKYLVISLIIFNVLMSESRGNILGIIILFLAISIKYINFEKITLYLTRNYILLLILFFLLLSPIAIIVLINNPLDERIIIWGNTLNTASNTLFFGVGIGNTTYSNSIAGYTNTYIFAPHSLMLEIFSDFGLVAFIMIIGLLLTLYIKLKGSSQSFLARMYIVLFLIVTIVPSSMIGAYYIWFGIGILFAQIKISDNIVQSSP